MDLEHPAEIWWGTYLKLRRRCEAGEGTAEDRKTMDLPAVRE